MGRTYHEPVMAAAVVALLAPARPRLLLDATFGGGGHTRALMEAFSDLRVVAIDADHDSRVPPDLGGVSLHHTNFRLLEAVLEEEEADELDAALFDLGVSSHQLDLGDRGFSYRNRGPLDMRMGPDAERDAARIVNDWDEGRLADVLWRFGEERHARRIARAIIAARPLEDTVSLAEVVAGAVPAGPRRRGHPARRTFQALRIAVNDELEALADGLDAALRVLRSGGRLAVISYHSLEDRIVKRRFASGAAGCTCPPELPVCSCDDVAELRIVTRRPVVPGDSEVEANRRARSARLRVAELL